MAKLLVRIVMLAFFVSCLRAIGFAQVPSVSSRAQQLDREQKLNKVTITTYFPPPYGVYNEFQLVPHDSPVGNCTLKTQGTMYLSTQNKVFVCDGTNWVPLGGGYWALKDNRLYHTNLGWNIGIGTNAPAPTYKLDVAGQINGRAGVCIGTNCKNAWDRITTCPTNQCLTYVNFNVPLSETTAQSSGTYVCKPCGGGTTTTLTEIPIPPSATCPSKSYGSNTPIGYLTANHVKCSCPPGYTTIRGWRCITNYFNQLQAKLYFDPVNHVVWGYCEGWIWVPDSGYGAVEGQVTGSGMCSTYVP